MFEHDIFGASSHVGTRHLYGDPAPTRHDLSKQVYMEEKKARLAAEAAEQRHIAKIELARRVTSLGRRLVVAFDRFAGLFMALTRSLVR